MSWIVCWDITALIVINIDAVEVQSPSVKVYSNTSLPTNPSFGI